MELREKAGGDSNFFKVEKKLQQLQKRQEERNQRAYEREIAKTDVFTFLNKTLTRKNPPKVSNDASQAGFSKSNHRRKLQDETSKDLNVNSMKVVEGIKRCERELWILNESLSRHTDEKSPMNKTLKAKVLEKQNEIDNLKSCELNILNEQRLRKDKKKLCIF